MSMINYASREINCKIVYYGPGLGGKTTNLEHVYNKVAPDAAGQADLPGHRDRAHALLRLPPGGPRHHPRLQDPVPPLHRAGAGLLQRLAQAHPQGRGRRGVRGRQPDRADGGEHRGDAEPVRQHGRSTATTSRASRSSSSTTSATCRTPPPSPSCRRRSIPAGRSRTRPPARRSPIPYHEGEFLVEQTQDGRVDRARPYFEAVAVTGDGVFDTLKAVSKLVLKTLG